MGGVALQLWRRRLGEVSRATQQQDAVESGDDDEQDVGIDTGVNRASNVVTASDATIGVNTSHASGRNGAAWKLLLA